MANPSQKQRYSKINLKGLCIGTRRRTVFFHWQFFHLTKRPPGKQGGAFPLILFTAQKKGEKRNGAKMFKTSVFIS